MTHTSFERAFTNGLLLQGNGETLSLRVESQPLAIRGPLYLRDPGFDDVQLTAALAPGDYHAEVSVACAGGNEVVAALRVIKIGARVGRWRDIGTLSCDTGWLCMATRAAAAPSQEGLWSYAPEVVASHAGFGDGGYGVFLGEDDDGAPVACVIDYFVLVRPVLVTLLIPPQGRVAHDSGVVVDIADDRIRVDATRAGEEVTGFELRAAADDGGELFVEYTAQGRVYDYVRPKGAARIELAFQAGVVAM